MARGFDTCGIRVLSENMDVRDFLAYNESYEVNRINPVSHFARREMTFPKALLGYQPPDVKKRPNPESTLNITDIPGDYLTARAALLCAMDFVTQTQLIAGMKRGSVHTFVLDAGGCDDAGWRQYPACSWCDRIPSHSLEELSNLF
jgi:hypothetical protein